MPVPAGMAAPSAALQQALRMLCALGWRHADRQTVAEWRGSPRELLLKPRLVDVLQTRRFDYKGRPCPLSPAGIEQILRELSSISLADGLLPANQRLYGKLVLGITVTEFMPDGKRHQPTIALVDWNDPAANHWEVADAVEVPAAHGEGEHRLGLVCYVNGIPLAIVEDGPTAVARQIGHQRPDQVPAIHAYAQLLLAVDGARASYGTTGTPGRLWARWRDEEFTDQHHAAWQHGTQKPSTPTEQDRLVASLLQPSRLLELLRHFVLFDRRHGKVVARSHQFFAVRTLVRRIQQRRPDGGREGGVVWHTAGSGKSYTMVFLTKALLQHDSLKACRVVVVTDRLDLEDQLARNFLQAGAFGVTGAARKEGEKARAASGKELARRIGQGTERIVFSLIHKFATASRLPECYNPSADLVVLVDESHRSHGGELHQRMRRALPRAACIAFTGTPLLKREKAAHRFGPIVHAYTMQRAVDDGTVVPLLYEERVPALSVDDAAVNRWFDQITAGLPAARSDELKRKFASRRAVCGAVSRIQLIAWDIATHFQQNVKALGLGLKGQVATAGKLDAIRYKRCLDDTGLVTSAVVISAPQTREGDVDEGALPEVQQWWRDHVGQDAAGYERRVLDGFASDDEPDLLIVVDRLLTGFDEPRNAVLYIDKPLAGHNLLQAIARVNRLHEAKRHGVLVDYRGILKTLDTTLRAYQQLEAGTPGGYDGADLEGLYRPLRAEYRRLPALHQALWDVFAGVPDRTDREQLRQRLVPLLEDDEHGGTHDRHRPVRAAFYAALRRFGRCLQTALASRGFHQDPEVPPSTIARYKADLALLTELCATVSRDAMEERGDRECEAQISRLLDREVTAQTVHEPGAVYAVHRLAGPAELPDDCSAEQARTEAALARARLTRAIRVELAGDPYAQQVFGELLQQAIAKARAMFEHPRRQYALLHELEQRVAQRALPGLPEALASQPRAQACFGILRLVLGEAACERLGTARLQDEARHIDAVVGRAVAENSLNLQNVDAAIRQALLPRLYPLIGLDAARQVTEQVMRLVRTDPGRPTGSAPAP
ncbi:HsdR family type I site-specific deoxyribonuclease [Schlegelella sp. S2-27]|uniref:Type I restriction enzyme endonuclease subunit n=1 Tax=Caldimonas mangrovi TaxID=2944811 RepID=A0ABT0YUW3_9BURK|nr:HsdR family type I site-specific deoxyribonuclease [Caldimonas mangrovi]MCM5682199.1 HsdR family type I site-specific deoxyribonuclease [Caldimonas mangrovi]